MGEIKKSAPKAEKPKPSVRGQDLFIVDNSDEQWKALRYLHDWRDIAKAMDIATGYFEIGPLLALDGQWQKLDDIRILMGDEVTKRIHQAFQEALGGLKQKLDESIETEKEKNDFLTGVTAIVDAFKTGKIVIVHGVSYAVRLGRVGNRDGAGRPSLADSHASVR